MRRSTRTQKRSKPTTADEKEKSPKPPPTKKKLKDNSDESSSDSDLENYLQPADQIDLNSSFFQVDKTNERKSFDSIENDIFAGTNRLSDSESEVENEQSKETTQNAEEKVVADVAPQTTKLNFEQLHNYTKKIEDAKKMVQKYEAKKKRKEQNKKQTVDDDITNLLSLGEMKVDVPEGFRKSVHSSDFESCSESDQEDWQEVEEVTAKPSSVPKDGVQITVALPENMKKKKGVDLVASMKRRLNRIKKENQILIHKVHLLCWIAHGNYVNKVLNGEGLLALSLSLIPSQHCYPPTRTDLGYLEQVVKWYNNTITLGEKQISKQWSLEKVLKLQLTRKIAYNKKMLVYIFICILRALGIQCRLVLSFQVLPLRPPNSELHSLSTKAIPSSSKKTAEEQDDANEKITSNDTEKTIPESNTSKTKKNEIKEKRKNIRAPKKDSTDGNPGTSNSIKDKETKGKKSNATKNGVTNEPCEIVFKKDSKDGQRVNTKNPLKTNDSKKKKPNLQNLKAENKNKENGESSIKESETKKRGIKKSNDKEISESKANTKRESTRTRSSLRTTTKESSTKSSKTKKIAQLDGADDSSDNEPINTKKPNLKKILKSKTNTCVKNHPKRLKSLPNYEEESDEDTDDDFMPKSNNNKGQHTNCNKARSLSASNTPKPKAKGDIKSDIISIMKSRIKEEQDIGCSKLVKNRKSRSQSDEDSDYAPEPIEKKYRSDDEFLEDKVKIKRRVKTKAELNEPEIKVKKGHDVWVEVFLEAEEKWISVDVVKAAVHCINGLYSRASHPISYIITWNNNNSIKDVTQRYCPNWNTTTRKLRVDPKWWTESLRPFIGQKTARDKEEDEDLAKLQLEKPLPTTISEYKNHPLYALKRHLLKFEALYPPNPAPLGFIRNEPVYARECVHVLHSRDMWMKQAKVVKLGEKPYKIVKARPKYDKLSGKVVTDLLLEIFGNWQIEDYVPPTAENGIVPKSAYGSVELFKPCMLPKKTVHLKLPGLNKIARKMNIDSAPALVGFDFHSGFNHPIYDGYVVCEEFEDILVAAWYLDQEEQEKRELEKLEKRVYGNWKKLIKGLLIRERLKAKYNFGETSQTEAKEGKKRKSKGPKFNTKKRRICSDSDSNSD